MRLSVPRGALRGFAAKRFLAVSNHQHRLFSGSEMKSESLKPHQFVAVPGNTEWIEDYIVGGYHPVHLGDVFNNRYRVIRKLGSGRFATVWLAKDESLGKYVALKFTVASKAATLSEAEVLTELRPNPNTSATLQLPVPKLLDSFALKGPNGLHEVLVLEPLGGTLQQFITEMRMRMGTEQDYRDVTLLRKLSRQVVYAVYCIHSKKIVHRDIRPGNVMFELKKPLDTLNEMDLNEHTRLRWSQNVFPLRRVDGKALDSHSPAYVVEPQSLENKIIDESLMSNSRLVLSDFGAATTFENANDGSHAYSAASRPPEVLLGLPVSEKSDIWALGCTIFHLVTLGEVFFVDSFKKGKEQDCEHLQSMIEVLGPMPEQMFQLWKERQSVVGVDGNLLEELLEDPLSDRLAVQIAERKPDSMSPKDASAFESFIQSIVRFEPETRPSAEELLRHRWLVE